MMSTTVFAAPEALNVPKMSPDAYLEMERKGIREVNGKYELFNQTLKLMSDESEVHITIAGNISAILNHHIWQNNFQFHVFQSEMSVISNSNYFYPDVIFINEKTIYTDKQKDVLVNPTILFEVLSDGTKNFDRTDKFESYKQIESLKEYILVDQYERRIEHFHKNDEGAWIKDKVYKNGELPLKSIPYSLPLKQIYHGMAF